MRKILPICMLFVFLLLFASTLNSASAVTIPCSKWVFQQTQGIWVLDDPYHYRSQHDTTWQTCNLVNDYLSNSPLWHEQHYPLWTWQQTLDQYNTPESGLFDVNFNTFIYVTYGGQKSGLHFYWDRYSYSVNFRIEKFHVKQVIADVETEVYYHELNQYLQPDGFWTPIHSIKTEILTDLGSQSWFKVSISSYKVGETTNLWNSWMPTGQYYMDVPLKITTTKDGPTPFGHIEVFRSGEEIHRMGDINGDGIVNIVDAGYIGAHWQETCPYGAGPSLDWELWLPHKADFDCNGIINIVESSVVGNWYGS